MVTCIKHKKIVVFIEISKHVKVPSLKDNFKTTIWLIFGRHKQDNLANVQHNWSHYSLHHNNVHNVKTHFIIVNTK